MLTLPCQDLRYSPPKSTAAVRRCHCQTCRGVIHLDNTKCDRTLSLSLSRAAGEKGKTWESQTKIALRRPEGFVTRLQKGFQPLFLTDGAQRLLLWHVWGHALDHAQHEVMLESRVETHLLVYTLQAA